MIENLVLGSAGWGPKTDKKMAFKLLDKFVESGGRYIDCATNYPINGIAGDFGLANKFLSDWISFNQKVDLNVFVKIGSMNNSGGPESDLSGTAIQRDFEVLQQNFGTNLGGVGIHWDNRGIDKVEQIKETIQQFDHLHHNGFRIGISGVREVKTYSQLASDLSNVWEIQVKETMDDHTIRDSYLFYFPEASYLVYGINGRKLLTSAPIGDNIESEILVKSQESKADLYFLWVKKILGRYGVKKVIIGPRTLQHLESILTRMTINNQELL